MSADLTRVADELDHIRRLQMFGAGRQACLARAAAELREVPHLHREIARLTALTRHTSRDADLPSVVSPAGA